MRTMRSLVQKRFVMGSAFGALLSLGFIAFVLCQQVTWSGSFLFPGWCCAIPDSWVSVLIVPGLLVTGLANISCGINLFVSILLGCAANGVAYGFLFVALSAPAMCVRAALR